MLDGSVNKNGNVGRTATDVHQRHSDLLFLRRYHRLRGSQLLENDVGDIESRTVAGFDDVLGAGNGAGHDVHPGFQSDAAHAQRLTDAVLVVDDELLGKDMDDLAVHGYGDGFRRIDHPAHVVRGNLAVLDGDHALGVEPLDMSARDPRVHRLYFAAGHQLGLFDSLLDGRDSSFDVDHDPFAQAAGRAGPDTDDVHSVFGHVADDGADLRGADIETHDQIFSPVGHNPSSVTPFLPQSCLDSSNQCTQATRSARKAHGRSWTAAPAFPHRRRLRASPECRPWR